MIFKFFPFCIFALLNMVDCYETFREPMQWDDLSTESEVSRGLYKVPAEGKVFQFVCTNYHHPCLTQLTTDINGEVMEFKPVEVGALTMVSSDWCSAHIDCDTLQISFAPNETSSERYVSIRVTNELVVTNEIVSAVFYFLQE